MRQHETGKDREAIMEKRSPGEILSEAAGDSKDRQAKSERH